MFAQDESAETTIMELMLTRITPASDVLWGADDPQTKAEWQVLTDAANKLIAAFEDVKQGGTGSNDDEWASSDKWQAYVNAEIDALENAKSAITAQDMDGLWAAGDALYTPCEACHIDFNPGVTSGEN